MARFLNPDGVVLMGRVANMGTAEEFLARERARWGDRFYFVNPKGGHLGEVPIYRSLAEVPGPVELAVVSVGLGQLFTALEDCAARGIKNVVVFTSGFAEVGEEGLRLESALKAHTDRLGLRVLGPNTNTNAFEPMPSVPTLRTGKIGLITQSGNQGRPFVQASPYGVGLSRWITTGNEIDLDVADFIGYFAADTETAAIGAYVEGFQDGEKLRSALRAAYEATTPVVMLKMGQTEAGRRMALSHTGHLTGSDAVIDGLFAQYGVTRVYDVDELIDTTNLFSKMVGQSPDRVDRVGIYGASGGVTTLMAESAQRHGLQVPVLAEATQRRLAAILPSYLSRSNPVDNGMRFLMEASFEDRSEVLRAIADDPEIDVIVAGNNMGEGPVAEAFVEDLVNYVSVDTKVPIVCLWGAPGDNSALFARLTAAEIPILRSSRAVMRSLRALHDYSSRPRRSWAAATPQRPDVMALLDGQSGVVSQDVAQALLGLAGIPTCEEYLVRTMEEAIVSWEAINASAVMKLASPDIPHRSEYGLVRCGVDDIEEVAAVFSELTETATKVRPAAVIDGVVIQREIQGGAEMLVGTVLDPVVGPAVTVGFGGVLAEVLADTAIRPLPLTNEDAWEMLRSLRGYSILEGVRGSPCLDVDGLVAAIMAVGFLMSSSGGRLAELEINPLIVSPERVAAVDVLAVAAEPDGDSDAAERRIVG